jgi:hypothetical protein
LARKKIQLSGQQRQLLAALRENTAVLKEMEEARISLLGQAKAASIPAEIIGEAMEVSRGTVYNRLGKLGDAKGPSLPRR